MNAQKLKQNIITELGLQNLPEKTQIKLLTQMTESVLKRIIVRVLERLDEAGRSKFEKLQKSGDPTKMDEFIKSKIPDYEQMVQGIVAEFKEEIKSSVAMLK